MAMVRKRHPGVSRWTTNRLRAKGPHALTRTERADTVHKAVVRAVRECRAIPRATRDEQPNGRRPRGVQWPQVRDHMRENWSSLTDGKLRGKDGIPSERTYQRILRAEGLNKENMKKPLRRRYRNSPARWHPGGRRSW